MTKISKDILHRIKEQGITPRPKWQFITLHIAMWVAFVLSVILGALAFSVILLSFEGIRVVVHRSGLASFISVLPYLWLVFLGLTLLLAQGLFSRTPKGYRRKPLIIMAVSLIVSLALGLMFYALGVGHAVDQVMTKRLPPYAQWNKVRERSVFSPENGIIIGAVKTLGEGFIVIEGPRGMEWRVSVATLSPTFDFERGMRLAIAVRQEGDSFVAEEVSPWRSRIKKRHFPGWGHPPIKK